MSITIFCPFDFIDFPFDEHDCNFTFTSSLSIAYVDMAPPIMEHKGQYSNGMNGLEVKSKRLPFTIKLTTLEAFIINIEGYDCHTAGLTIHLSRKDLGVLTGSFYGPTAIFAFLSMISFIISPDAVSIKCIM